VPFRSRRRSVPTTRPEGPTTWPESRVSGGSGSGTPTAMLAAILIAGLVVAPLASGALFVPAGLLLRRTRGWWPATRRLVSALVGTAVLAAVAYAVLRWFGASTRNTVAGTAAIVVASLLWLPATRRWNARGHLCWACS